MEKKEIFMIVLIGLVLLTVAIQTIQLVGLNNTQVAATPAGSGMMQTHAAAGSPSVPSNLENLPSMVGGC